MRQPGSFILMAVLVSQVNSAPQLISFQDGKLGVNFGGYHAGVGLGGLLGGGAGGGLFAEAGTPHGQSAKAGLGGAVSSDGGTAGGLFAGATAGGNIKASAGLAGGTAAEKTAGAGFASAQSGHHYASSGLGGHSGVEGSAGFTFSGSNSAVATPTIVKEVSVVETKPVLKKVYTEIDVDSANEVNAVPLHHKTAARAEIGANFHVKANAQPDVIVKEVYVQPQPEIVEKHIIHTRVKPHRHRVHNKAFIGGFIGTGANVAQPTPVVYKTVQPAIDKRIDIGVESSANAGAVARTNVNDGGAGHVTYTKELTYSRNSNFFDDIFNIPISTLRAVGNLLGNAAGSTSVSVQKTGSIQAGGYV